MMRRRSLLIAAAAAAGLPAAEGIRVGCQSRSYAPPSRDVRQFLGYLDDMAAAGYEGFETNYISLEAGFTDPAPLRAEIAERKMELIGLHAGSALHTPEQTVKAEELFARVAAGVKALGGSYAMLSPAAGKDAGLWKSKAEAIERLAAICRKAGVELLVHNHVEEARNNFEELRFLLRASSVRLLVDIGHAARAGVNAAEFCEQHHARIAAVHVKDWKDDHNTQVTLGRGDVPVISALAALRKRKWRGWVIAELEGNAVPGVTREQNVRDARAFLSQVL
ncbi:MAG: sugar phosphate isomerase/epimerase [Bryobacterales bacterium]|nr:sugar phosphate isomerase/epimerase [Bryobacterales bacterium]